MRSRSNTWKNIVATGEFNMETVVRIYGAQGSDADAVSGSDSYGAYREYHKITAPVITRNLLGGDKLSIGNCTIGILNFSVLTTDTIPKSAKIVVRSRPYSGDVYAEWMEFGTFWIDERTIVDDLTTIIANDSMKMGYQVYSDDSITRNWPKSIKTVVVRIAEQMGITIDSRTVAQIINAPVGENVIVLKPDDNDSLLDILGHIGGVIGGNWTITTDNKLRFIPLASIPEYTNYIIDNQNQYNYISTENGDTIIWRDNENESSDSGDIDVFTVPVVIGSLNTSRQYSISKVTMSFDDEHVYSYGDNTGFELLVEDNPYATPGLCKALYNTASGVVYAPFNIESACYDPAAEIGDGLIINMQEPIASILFNEVRTFDVVFRADASAPGEDETESEYPYKTAWQRMKYEIEDATVQLGRELRSVISQTQTEIMQTVSDTYTTREDTDLVELITNSKIAQRADSIILSVEKHYTTKGETETVQHDLESSIDQTADKILLTVSDNYSTKSETETVQHNLESAINQTADRILLTVSDNYSTKTETGTVRSELESSIEQTASQIKLDVKKTTDGLDGRLSSAESSLSLIPGQIAAKVSKDGVIGQFLLNIQQGTESDKWESVAQLTADKIDLSGYVTFTDLSTEGQTEINGANIKTGTITATQLSSAVTDPITTATDMSTKSASREQYIYISKPSTTGLIEKNLKWVTDATGNQNTWTTTRPELDKDNYPVLFIAKQSQSFVQRYTVGGNCSCTDPVIDQTTTVIDGGRIITGSITTNQLAAHQINVDRLTGNITNSGWGLNFANGSFSIGTISVSKITGSKQMGNDWSIDFDNGSLTIGNISADKIESIPRDKITGEINDGGWGINFSNGTFSIGEISADKITTGTLDADKIVLKGGFVQEGQLSGASAFQFTDGVMNIYVTNSHNRFTNIGSLGGGSTLAGTLIYNEYSVNLEATNPVVNLDLGSKRYIIISAKRIYTTDENRGTAYRGYTGSIGNGFSAFNGIVYKDT